MNPCYCHLDVIVIEGGLKNPDMMLSSLNQKACQYWKLQSFMKQFMHLPLWSQGSCSPPLHINGQFAALSRQATVRASGPGTTFGALARLWWRQPMSHWFCQGNARSKRPLMRPWTLHSYRSEWRASCGQWQPDSTRLSWVQLCLLENKPITIVTASTSCTSQWPANPFIRFSPIDGSY